MKITVAGLLVLLLCFVSCKKDAEEMQPPDPAGPRVSHSYSLADINAFKELTVNGEFNDGYIKKLPDTTFVYLADTLYPFMTGELAVIMSDINYWAGGHLSLQRTRDSALAVIQVHLTDSTTYVNAEPAAAIGFAYYTYELIGLTTPTWTSGNIISHEGVFVDMFKTGNNTFQQRYLLRHEMTHALGLYGHVHNSDYYSSVMYSYMIVPYTTSYSSFDGNTIQLLYDPVVKAGMNETSLNDVLY